MKKKEAVDALSALAQQSRLDVFRLLVRAGPDGIPAGELGERLGLPSATLSFHLNTLRHARLIENRRDGRRLIYGARLEAISELMGFLMENCCQGHPEACAFLNSARARARRRH